MPLLVRRINRAKWGQIVTQTRSNFNFTNVFNFLKKKNDVSADAITNCLKTSNNDLSVWHIENDSNLDNAILALITGSKQAKLSTLHIVKIDEKVALKKGITLSCTPGDTAVKDLISHHKDITNLTYTKLGIIKELIVDCINEGKYSFYTKKQLKDIIIKALKDGRVHKSDLPQELVLSENL